MTSRHRRARDTSRAFVWLCGALAALILVSTVLWFLHILAEVMAFIMYTTLFIVVVIAFVTIGHNKKV